MSDILSPLTMHPTPARLAVYRVLCESPRATWTVTEMVVEVSRTTRTSGETVRATLYVLAQDGILCSSYHGTSLRFGLAEGGRERLGQILHDARGDRLAPRQRDA